MWKVLVAGVVLALVIVVLTIALHLLNRPSDAAVAGGYLILLVLLSLAVGAVQRYWRG